MIVSKVTDDAKSCPESLTRHCCHVGMKSFGVKNIDATGPTKKTCHSSLVCSTRRAFWLHCIHTFVAFSVFAAESKLKETRPAVNVIED